MDASPTLLRNSKRSNYKSSAKFIKHNRSFVVLLIVFALCVPASFGIADVFMWCCADYLSSISKPIMHNSIPDNNTGNMQQESKTISAENETAAIQSLLNNATDSNFEDISNDANCQRRIVGYYNLDQQWELRDEQLNLISHIIFLPVDVQLSGVLTLRNKEIKEKLKRYINKASSFNVTTMFSTGDGSYNGDTFSRVVEDLSKRRVLISSISSFLHEFNLDGVDVNWYFPRTPQDKINIVHFCKQLRTKLDNFTIGQNANERYLISVVSQSVNETDNLEISKYIDFLNINSYSYYYAWHPEVGHVVGPSSPLFTTSGKYPNHNVDFTMRKYSCQIKNSSMLNMGVAFTGNYWNNVIVPKSKQISARTIWMEVERTATGNIDGGHWPYGFLRTGYGWNDSLIFWNHETKTPYMWNPEKRIYWAFEDERSLREKIKYAEEKNIGGFTIWQLNFDDWDNTLLKAISKGRQCKGNLDSINYNCYI